MWQPGETMTFRASDHVRAIYEHAGAGLLDYAIVNTGSVRPALRKKYASQQVKPVEADIEGLERLGVKIVAENLLQESATVRHNASAAAAVAMRLAREGRGRRK